MKQHYLKGMAVIGIVLVIAICGITSADIPVNATFETQGIVSTTSINVQGSMIKDVQKAIWVSETPRFLNIRAEDWAIATKGNPMAKYTEGIQVAGCRGFVSICDINVPRF